MVLWTLLGSLLFRVLVWVPETFSHILLTYALMSMFFYGSAAVKFAYLADLPYPHPHAGHGLLRIAGSHPGIGRRAIHGVSRH